MFNAVQINRRIKKPLSLSELAVITALLIFIVYITLTHLVDRQDFIHYMNTTHGDYGIYFYGYWILPVFNLFNLLPFDLAFILWSALGVMGVWFAARVFNGKSVPVLLSYQFFCMLYWGQMTGIFCGVLALFWWAIHEKKWIFAGFTLLIAIAKPQSAGLLAFFLWLFADIPWSKKLQLLIIPLAGVLLSFWFYPGWLFDVYSRSQNPDVLVRWGNISLFQWVGGFAFLLFVPLFFVRMKKQDFFLALTCGCSLSVPYFQQADMIVFMIFPVGLVPVLLGYLPGIAIQFFIKTGLALGALVPLFIYFNLLYKNYLSLEFGKK